MQTNVLGCDGIWVREGVLVGVIKRVKIPKIKGHGATFMSLRACDGDYKEGVCHDIKTEIESFI